MSQLYASLFYQNEVTEIFSDRALVSVSYTHLTLPTTPYV